VQEAGRNRPVVAAVALQTAVVAVAPEEPRLEALEPDGRAAVAELAAEQVAARELDRNRRPALP